MSSDKINLQAGFAEAVESHLVKNFARVSSFEFEGQRYWIKQVEQTTGRTRILKPAPKHGFSREIKAYEALSAKGAPVPEILIRNAQYVVFTDAGRTLSFYWRDEKVHPKERASVSKQAGEALARLHSLGVSHGRPVVRDICWNGNRITFLDFENYSIRRNGVRGRAFDLLCFVHSICSQPIKDEAALEAAIDGYRKMDQDNVWNEARILARRLRWIEVLSRPMQKRKDPHAREFKSLPKVRKIFID